MKVNQQQLPAPKPSGGNNSSSQQHKVSVRVKRRTHPGTGRPGRRSLAGSRGRSVRGAGWTEAGRTCSCLQMAQCRGGRRDGTLRTHNPVTVKQPRRGRPAAILVSEPLIQRKSQFTFLCFAPMQKTNTFNSCQPELNRDEVSFTLLCLLSCL